MAKKKVCCLCGKEYEEKGNNPFPVDKEKGHLCCDTCAYGKVVPARMRMLMGAAASAARAEVGPKTKKTKKTRKAR